MAATLDKTLNNTTALQRSSALHARLREDIVTAGGALRFDEFMQRVLYTPELGYYTAADPILGRSGDFITAPEIAPLFAQCLARWCSVLLPKLSTRHLYEVGGGSGTMAVNLLKSLAELSCLPEQYILVEVSPVLRARQQALIQTEIPQLASRVQWQSVLPDSVNGIIIANELLDAMPVRRFYQDNQGFQEQFVSVAADQLQFIYQPITDTRLQERLQAIERQQGTALPPGYLSEVNFMAEDWITHAVQSLQQGVMLLIDYGYPRAIYYHPQRSSGTLVCHYHHSVNTTPLERLGLQDITAFIDFTAIAGAAQQAGADVVGFSTQAHFLLDLGILDLLGAQMQSQPEKQLEFANQIKRLTLPHEMGEAFKVLALSKKLAEMPPGFGFRNRVEELFSV